jgi:leucine--tRNA ligase
MVSPVAPHVAEELWSRLGHPGSLAREAFPVVEDESLLVDETVTCVVQVRGKLRDRLEVPADVSEEDLAARALASQRVRKFLDGEPAKIVVRAPRLVNIVP